jgi:hypothetical protein
MKLAATSGWSAYRRSLSAHSYARATEMIATSLASGHATRRAVNVASSLASSVGTGGEPSSDRCFVYCSVRCLSTIQPPVVVQT